MEQSIREDHTPPKIKRTYDPHEYLHEKQDAFKRLADHIDMIVNGQFDR